jgi:hypothetical protein
VVLRPDVDGTRSNRIELDLDGRPPRGAVPGGGPRSTAAGPTGSALRVGASLEVDFEQPTGDDAQTTEVAVAARGAVLVIGDPAAAALLRAQGFDVEEGSPDRVARRSTRRRWCCARAPATSRPGSSNCWPATSTRAAGC